jgi:neutral ceramidase
MKCLAIVWAGLCLAGALEAAPEFRVGAARSDITPPAGWRKAGSYDEAISTGVADPLYAKALVFEQGAQRAALVVCDLTGSSRPVCDRARAEVEKLIGIPATNISISATHTHGSPEFHGVLWDIWRQQAIARDGRDASAPFDYQAFLAERIVAAITNAWAARTAVRLETALPDQPGVAFNRRFHMKDGTVRFNPGKQNPDIVRPAGPTDTALPIVLFRDTRSGNPLATLSSFAMHVATFYDAAKFGADFPGVLQSELQRDFGDRFISVFGEGCAGDVNHIDVSSGDPQAGNTEPQRIGTILAATVRDALRNPHKESEPSLGIRSAMVPAPILELFPGQVERARAVLANLISSRPAFMLQVEAYRILNIELLRQRHGDTLPMEVQAFRLGRDTAFVTLPHEVFVELGLAIRTNSPFAHTQVITIANDVDWYVPTLKASAEGSYEVTTSAVRPGAGERLVEAALRLLRELKAESRTGE